MGIDLVGLELDLGDVVCQQASDAALLRALLDAARIRGVVVLLRGGTVAIGSEPPTSHPDLRTAAVMACERLGLDPDVPRSQQVTQPDVRHVPLPDDSGEGGDG